ncbi:hypothetical protein [Pseudomonas fluorescens]|uniref:Uncharacterized protein n=1 Tax=Pseudomonas fluorescens TaxID=294 RepID=A0A7Z6MZ79_PSEFL|nr:hypothetical protein [Pseudomonas fluorescens]RDS91059.1 hypothetical protein DL347_10055 [Pseudomonas fluorescens]
MSAIGNYFGATQNYGANNPISQNTNSSLSAAEDNFQKGEAINDYTTKKQLEAKLTSGINQAAKSFQ